METKIIRSAKRRKTVQARVTDGVLEVFAPARMSDRELRPIIDNLKKRIERRKRAADLDDPGLQRLALDLNRTYFDGRLTWESIRWVSNQEKCHGSCTPGRRTIRISHRMAGMPRFVLEYVIVHELTHLLHADHGREFWRLVNRYPRTERARGYLMAVGLENEE
jgi:predicted metal-dependent hydrolase